MKMFTLLVFMLVILPFSAKGGEIIGGVVVTPHSRPYMVYVTSYMNNSFKWGCGGFLVREDIVMTAAHCYRSKINVTLGAHNIKKNENTQQVIPVVQVAYPIYNSTTKINDIMLLKLKYKAQLNNAVKTIALPKSQDWVRPGQVCQVAGWGRTENRRYSDVLREVNLEVQNEQKCHEIFLNYNNSIQLCVGNPKYKKATDYRDSGGPFVCNGVAQGIVSYQYSTSILPQVFTRISSYVTWIEKAIKILEHP